MSRRVGRRHRSPESSVCSTAGSLSADAPTEAGARALVLSSVTGFTNSQPSPQRCGRTVISHSGGRARAMKEPRISAAAPVAGAMVRGRSTAQASRGDTGSVFEAATLNRSIQSRSSAAPSGCLGGHGRATRQGAPPSPRPAQAFRTAVPPGADDSFRWHTPHDSGPTSPVSRVKHTWSRE